MRNTDKIIAKSFAQAVCFKLKIDAEQYFSPSRKQYLCDARSCVYNILVKRTPLTLMEIAQIHRRHHSTIINGLNWFYALNKTEPEFQELNRQVLDVAKDYYEINKQICCTGRKGFVDLSTQAQRYADT